MSKVRCPRCNRVTHPLELVMVHGQLWVCLFCMEGR